MRGELREILHIRELDSSIKAGSQVKDSDASLVRKRNAGVSDEYLQEKYLRNISAKVNGFVDIVEHEHTIGELDTNQLGKGGQRSRRTPELKGVVKKLDV